MQDEKIHKVEGTWKQFSTGVKKAWSSLKDEEITRYKGSRDKLESYIVKTTGEKLEAVRKRVGEIAKSVKHSF